MDAAAGACGKMWSQFPRSASFLMIAGWFLIRGMRARTIEIAPRCRDGESPPVDRLASYVTAS